MFTGPSNDYDGIVLCHFSLKFNFLFRSSTKFISIKINKNYQASNASQQNALQFRIVSFSPLLLLFELTYNVVKMKNIYTFILFLYLSKIKFEEKKIVERLNMNNKHVDNNIKNEQSCFAKMKKKKLRCPNLINFFLVSCHYLVKVYFLSSQSHVILELKNWN